MSDKTETVAVDPNAKPVVTQQIQTEEAAKATAQFLEVARNMNATVENKMDAFLAMQTAISRRPVVDDRPVFDDIDVKMARNITELYDAHIHSDLGKAVLRVADRMYLENQIENEVARREKKAAVPMNKSRLWPLYESVLKRADIWNTATSNEGQEWAPIGVSTQRIDLARIEARVPALFPQIPIRSMRSMYVPTLAGAATVRVMSQFAGTTAPLYSGTTTPNNPTIGQMQITPIKHATDPAFINMEMLEDSPTAVLDALQMEVANALAHGWESAIINGQATSNDANLDGANGPVAANATYNGLRFYSVVTNANTQSSGGGALGYDDFVALLAKMGIHGLKNAGGNVGATVCVLSPKALWDLTSSDAAAGTAGPISGYAIFGPGNPMPVGTVTMLHGIPILATQNMPAMLATGKVGASSNNFTGGLIVDTSRWRVGVAREIEVKTVPFDLDDAIGVRGFARHGLGSAPPTTDKHTGMFLNIAA